MHVIEFFKNLEFSSKGSFLNQFLLAYLLEKEEICERHPNGSLHTFHSPDVKIIK